MKAILDAGALVAVDRRNRLIGAQLRVLQQQGTPIRVSSAVVGQVWRDGRTQANLARVLAGVGIEALGKDDGKRIGELLALSGSADIVDAHVALITAHADLVLTSDPGDIGKLLQARGVSARVQTVLRLLGPANLSLPAASCASGHVHGRIKLRQILPGGHVDPGESASDAAVRETAEESGITVEITGLVGIYPGHVIADPRAGLVRQPFAVCFHASPLSGSPGGDQVETSDARWFTTGDIPALPIRPAMRLRIDHALTPGPHCHIG